MCWGTCRYQFIRGWGRKFMEYGESMWRALCVGGGLKVVSAWVSNIKHENDRYVLRIPWKYCYQIIFRRLCCLEYRFGKIGLRDKYAENVEKLVTAMLSGYVCGIELLWRIQPSLAPLLLHQISLIHGSRINQETPRCPQFCPYNYKILSCGTQNLVTAGAK